MFREYHVPESIMEMKRREFEDLQQGSYSMVKYTNEFNKLARYAADEVDTDKKRIKKFLKGLDPYAAMQLKMSKPGNFQELMNSAITWENDYKLVQQNRLKKARTEVKRFQPTRTTPNLSFRPRVRTGGVPMVRKPFNPRSNIICHTCGAPGHMSKDCKKPR